jgi:K+-sensing histidine kinase KdpD
MALATCRSIIDAHNGRLWASANQPRGAVCQFTLPADQTTDVMGQNEICKNNPEQSFLGFL